MTLNYQVRRIEAERAKAYIHEHHYSHGSHRGPSPCYGLFDGDTLIGVCMFAQPVAESVREQVFGPGQKHCVIELHRLHLQDHAPPNSETYFISRCLRQLRKDRPDIKAVLSFSDTTAGHTGLIYRAANALYLGTAKSRPTYMDETGRLRHHRQCGVTISQQDALARGWTIVRRKRKHKYLWLLGSPREKRRLYRMLLVEPRPYKELA